MFLLTGDLLVWSSKKQMSKRSYKSKRFTVVYVCEGRSGEEAGVVEPADHDAGLSPVK